jgi:hypothetical protein
VATRVPEQQQQSPESALPVTFALSPQQDLMSRTRRRSPRGPPGAAAARRLPRADPEAAQLQPHSMSHRLLLAIGATHWPPARRRWPPRARSSRSSIASRPRGADAALRRLDLDVVVLHDELSGVAPIELAPRSRPASRRSASC